MLVGQKATSDILDPETHKVILKKHRRITEGAFKKLELAKINTISVEPQDLIGKYLARDVVDPETGEVIAEYNDEVTEKLLKTIKERKIETFEILFIDNINVSSSFRDTLVMDKIELEPRGKGEIAHVRARQIRPGERIGEGPDRYLQKASTGRPAHDRNGHGSLLQPLLQSRSATTSPKWEG